MQGGSAEAGDGERRKKKQMQKNEARKRKRNEGGGGGTPQGGEGAPKQGTGTPTSAKQQKKPQEAGPKAPEHNSRPSKQPKAAAQPKGGVVNNLESLLGETSKKRKAKPGVRRRQGSVLKGKNIS